MKKLVLLHSLIALFYIKSQAQTIGMVSSHQKISATSGNFTGSLNVNDQFGRNLTNIGDLNGDGIEDLAVGANLDDDGGNNKGAVWILFMNTNGTVSSHQKISIGNGGFTGFPDAVFGTSIGLIGDLNGDGIQDIVVGETDSNDGAPQAGAVWILFMNMNGTVNSHQKISSTSGNLNISLVGNGRFGSNVTGIGDIDGDGILDIAVSQMFANNGGSQKGAVWILNLNTNGTVKTRQSISATTGGFTGDLDNNDNFGSAVASFGDFDNDGINDILVGARNDDDGGTDKGAVWILYLNANGTVKTHHKISNTQGNFTGSLDFQDKFGIAIDALGDIDGDNITDIVIGGYLDDDGGTDRGAVWILFMNANGTVKGHQKISDTQGNFSGQLDNQDAFGGWGISMLNDLNNDGTKDLAVCAYSDDDGGFNTGAVWILFLNCDVGNLTDLDLGQDTIVCNSSNVELDATNSNATNYLWQDGSTNSTFNVTQSGNYFVTISNTCESISDTIEVFVFPEVLPIDLGQDTILCIGETLTLNTSSNDVVGYEWQDNSTDSIYLVTQSGQYSVTLTGQCNHVSDTINVMISSEFPTINIQDLTDDVCIGNTTDLIVTVLNANSFEWQDGSTNPILNVSSEGTYSVLAMNNCGQSEDSIYVNFIDCNCYIGVPNIFSPNGDLHNNTFSPKKGGVCDFINYKFMIFNRWGNLMFETNTFSIIWDGIYKGQEQPMDTYTWILEYELETGGQEILKGSVLLVR